MDDLRPFDLLGPLPGPGVTVLEASAGTGKTFTIAALAVRFVASGAPLDRVLIVTFTRLATSELRDRVRHRLVTAAEALRAITEGEPVPPGDELVAFLATGTPEEVSCRRDRLHSAVANFDAATIATTHGFCQQVLQGLGVLGDAPQEATVLEDPSDLVTEVVDDRYTRHVLELGSVPFDRRQALAIGRCAVANPQAPIEPRHAEPSTPSGLRRRLAKTTRDELERRKRAGGLLTYDDLVTRLHDTLTDDKRGAAACARLRERYQVALVDEFQDTDPVQWGILARAFGDGQATLVLIGDPKQAIYGFRGADVYAYLDAARRADHQATLSTNFRSDADYLAAVEALLGQARLGHNGIPFRAVEATADHRTPGLQGAPDGAPLRFRVLDRSSPAVRKVAGGAAAVGPARQLVAADVAGDIAALLRSGALVRPVPARDAATEVRAGDVAVL
ncbi:MAG TPA: UvrD-helicase domain-containing protein, partial [Acidimicrobiales bacterium]